METVSKKRLLIFALCTYGVAYLMGIFMYIGLKKEVDLTTFVNAQMLYPACGVGLGLILVKDGKEVPKAPFITLFVTTIVMMGLSIASVMHPMEKINLTTALSMDIYALISNYVIMAGSIVAYILFWTCSAQKRDNVGLTRRNMKQSALMIGLFLLLYFIRLFLAFAVEGIQSGDGLVEFVAWLKIFKSPVTWAGLSALPLNFFFVFLAFFGEEYGWRYYLQPMLQKKFGLRLGVIVLGLLWAIWHLPIDMFFYTTTTGPQMLANQVITCTAYAVFFGYAYMKTNNILVPVILHYLNNNLVPIISGAYNTDVFQNQEMQWSQLPIMAVIMIAYYAFIFAPEYKKKTIALVQENNQGE